METVSVIITVLNGSEWIKPCFDSILQQVGSDEFQLEICVFDDASTDGTYQMVLEWNDIFRSQGIRLVVTRSESEQSQGVGYGRNKAIETASGKYLCFQDIDDVMQPSRISRQLKAAKLCGDRTIVGSKFERVPKNSTIRFTNWANTLNTNKLSVQIYTSHGPTLIMPTWFCHRAVFDAVGGFESGLGVPEDLIFFYRHLTLGGKLFRVDEKLLLYTYHVNAATFSVKKDTIWNLRVQHLIANELRRQPWSDGFTIWNASKQGRRFYRSLPGELQVKVKAFCDVDPKLIGGFYNHFDTEQRREMRNVPIVSYRDARPPIVICFKLDLSSGAFEKNLEQLRLEEGKDYILFS